MNAENEFERWWEDTSYGDTVPITDGQLYDICRSAFALGRKSGLEEAAEIAMQKDCPHDLGCGQSVAAAIRQRIEETE